MLRHFHFYSMFSFVAGDFMPIHSAHSVSNKTDEYSTSVGKSGTTSENEILRTGHGDALPSISSHSPGPDNVKSFLNVLGQYDLTRWSPLEDENEDILLEELRELDDVQLIGPGK